MEAATRLACAAFGVPRNPGRGGSMNPLQAATIALALTVAAAEAEARPGAGDRWQGGSTWQGERSGVWPGGHRGYWHGGSRWSGGWYGPGVGLYLGLPGFWGWPYDDLAWTAPYGLFMPEDSTITWVPVPATPVPINYWYYCTSPAGYFPYVPSCNEAWIPVLPPDPVPSPSGPAP
jgi:hypothetical protein